MSRADGFGNSLPAAWARRREPGGARTRFGSRPIRVAAAIVFAVLVLGNAVIAFRLMGEDASVPSRAPRAQGPEDTAAISFKDLREALQSAQASMQADLERVLPSRIERSERNDNPKETSNTETGTTSGSTSSSSSGSSSSGSTSSGSTSSGSGSGTGGSDSTDTGSGGGSGGSSGGEDTGGGDTSGSGPGGGGGDSGGGGDDTGGGGSGGGGGGGGG